MPEPPGPVARVRAHDEFVRAEIESLGGEIRFYSRVEDFLVDAGLVEAMAKLGLRS